jgi:uncharacterized protein YcsI (UPF0317 family)
MFEQAKPETGRDLRQAAGAGFNGLTVGRAAGYVQAWSCCLNPSPRTSKRSVEQIPSLARSLAALEAASLPFFVTHAPGAMLVTDLIEAGAAPSFVGPRAN